MCVMQNSGRILSAVVLLFAAVWTFQRAQHPEYIGIDFVQFWITGQHVTHGGDPRIYSDDVRARVLETAWQEARAEGTDFRFYRAVEFRHQRSWETYSSPFLYSVFGAVAREALSSPGAPGSATFSPESGEKDKGEEYEVAIRKYWLLCLGSTVVGFVGFGWALRIPGSSMLVGALILAWFSPLRIDLNVGNVNQIQFGMLGVLAVILSGCGTANSRRRSGGATVGALAGFWMGLCLAFKPSLLWCGVMLMVSAVCGGIRDRGNRIPARRDSGPREGTERTGRWGRRRIVSATVGGFAGGMVAVGFSSLWFPLSSWLEWVQAVRSLPDDIIRTHQGNFSPTYFAGSYGVPGWLLSLAGPGVAVAAVALTAKAEARHGASRHIDEIRHGASGHIDEIRHGASGHIDEIRHGASGHIGEIRHEGSGHIGTVRRATRADRDIRWLAIGCQIHLLTSHLVWYHYFVLSLPAVLVILKYTVTTSAAMSLRVVPILILVWCLVLLGLEPIDGLLSSPPDEHFLRCLLANAFLLAMVVWIEP